MKAKWLGKNNSSKLLIYFAGWGMNGSEVSHLQAGQFDVLCFYDYRGLEVPTSVELDYSQVYVVAWSFGVACATSTLPNLNLPKPIKSIAINGTLLPIDKNFGIPSTIFQATLKNLNQKTRDKFLLRTCGSASSYANFIGQVNLRDVQQQREELAELGKTFNSLESYDSIFDLAIVGISDKIIPAQNQLAFWQRENCRLVTFDKGAHFLFDKWKSWQEIVEL